MASAPPRGARPPEPRFHACVVRDARELERARRFRLASVARDTGFRTSEDPFDAHGDILAVTDARTDEIVGSCRVLSPEDARRAGGNDVDRRFDTALLIVLRSRMVEVDTPCVSPLYRYENVVTHLWAMLTRYLIDNRHDYVLGTARVSILDGGHAAASTHRLACARLLSPEDLRVHPRRPLAFHGLSDTRPVVMPPLLKAYTGIGAWVCGEPALRPEIAAAEFPLLLPLSRMQGRDARSFLARAA